MSFVKTLPKKKTNISPPKPGVVLWPLKMPKSKFSSRRLLLCHLLFGRPRLQQRGIGRRHAHVSRAARHRAGSPGGRRGPGATSRDGCTHGLQAGRNLWGKGDGWMNSLGDFALMILGAFLKNMFVDFWLMFGLIFW